MFRPDVVINSKSLYQNATPADGDGSVAGGAMVLGTLTECYAYVLVAVYTLLAAAGFQMDVV